MVAGRPPRPRGHQAERQVAFAVRVPSMSCARPAGPCLGCSRSAGFRRGGFRDSLGGLEVAAGSLGRASTLASIALVITAAAAAFFAGLGTIRCGLSLPVRLRRPTRPHHAR